MLQPNQHWRWHISDQYLALELGNNMCFQTAYDLKSLISCAQNAEQFTLEQHAIYSTIIEELDELERWSDAEKTQFAMNALALCCFGKPMAAKSWHFEPAPARQIIAQYQIAYIQIDGAYSTIIVLQLETNSAYCMLLESDIKLENGKVLSRFSPLKVMTNRLFSRPL
jgi:hypothetical protein